ncbi:hypothetical protein LR48_Vigan02g213200 [Vigna angularis]|uniref:Uncharacterized protein n=1 Tax=Phaseolus angularis TaxID=3914 RepID=A0A0L9U008_PHAAN|nr:hypothetical protein LR48_Vigan02g213200 [Vigna angularis]
MDEIFFSDDLLSNFTRLSKREIEHESCTEDRSRIMRIKKGVEIFETLMTDKCLEQENERRNIVCICVGRAEYDGMAWLYLTV